MAGSFCYSKPIKWVFVDPFCPHSLAQPWMIWLPITSPDPLLTVFWTDYYNASLSAYLCIFCSLESEFAFPPTVASTSTQIIRQEKLHFSRWINSGDSCFLNVLPAFKVGSGIFSLGLGSILFMPQSFHISPCFTHLYTSLSPSLDWETFSGIDWCVFLIGLPETKWMALTMHEGDRFLKSWHNSKLP